MKLRQGAGGQCTDFGRQNDNAISANEAGDATGMGCVVEIHKLSAKIVETNNRRGAEFATTGFMRDVTRQNDFANGPIVLRQPL